MSPLAIGPNFCLSNSNTTGGTDLVQGVKYYLIDPNNRLQPNYSTAVYPGDPGFRGLKYPGEFLSYDVPGYGTLTIGDKYYLQSEQVLSEYVSFEVMERIGNFGTTRGWTWGAPYGSTRVSKFVQSRPRKRCKICRSGPGLMFINAKQILYTNIT